VKSEDGIWNGALKKTKKNLYNQIFVVPLQPSFQIFGQAYRLCQPSETRAVAGVEKIRSSPKRSAAEWNISAFAGNLLGLKGDKNENKNAIDLLIFRLCNDERITKIQQRSRKQGRDFAQSARHT
jgi:hypothetical protein